MLALTAEMVAGEIGMMERVGGRPHVLPLEGVFVSRATREVALVLPLMANGSLHDLLLDPEVCWCCEGRKECAIACYIV